MGRGPVHWDGRPQTKMKPHTCEKRKLVQQIRGPQAPDGVAHQQGWDPSTGRLFSP